MRFEFLVICLLLKFHVSPRVSPRVCFFGFVFACLRPRRRRRRRRRLAQAALAQARLKPAAMSRGAVNWDKAQHRMAAMQELQHAGSRNWDRKPTDSATVRPLGPIAAFQGVLLESVALKFCISLKCHHNSQDKAVKAEADKADEASHEDRSQGDDAFCLDDEGMDGVAPEPEETPDRTKGVRSHKGAFKIKVLPGVGLLFFCALPPRPVHACFESTGAPMWKVFSFSLVFSGVGLGVAARRALGRTRHPRGDRRAPHGQRRNGLGPERLG